MTPVDGTDGRAIVDRVLITGTSNLTIWAVWDGCQHAMLHPLFAGDDQDRAVGYCCGDCGEQFWYPDETGTRL